MRSREGTEARYKFVFIEVPMALKEEVRSGLPCPLMHVVSLEWLFERNFSDICVSAVSFPFLHATGPTLYATIDTSTVVSMQYVGWETRTKLTCYVRGEWTRHTDAPTHLFSLYAYLRYLRYAHLIYICIYNIHVYTLTCNTLLETITQGNNFLCDSNIISVTRFYLLFEIFPLGFDK